MQVIIWDLPNNGASLSDYESLEKSYAFEAHPSEVCSTVQWVSSTVLVTGNADNSLIKLWHMAESAECLHRVKFTSSTDPQAFFNHMVVQPEAGLVILANAKQSAVYTLHLTGSAEQTRFDYMAEFVVSMPILSVTAQYRPSDDPSALQLYCVQAQAIQMYTLNLALCWPASPQELPTTMPEDMPANSLQQTPAGAQSLVPLSPIGSAQPEPLHQQPGDLLSGTSIPLQQPEASSQQQPPSIRTTAPPPTATVEQPKLLTPTHLMQQAKRSASQSSMASLPSQHTPTSTSRVLLDNSDVVSTASTQGSKLQEGSVSRQHSAETIPSSAAALDASTSAQYDSPTASLSDSRANTPPPFTPALPSAAYLTPEHYNVPESLSAEAQHSAGSMLGHRLDLASTPSGSNTVKLLKREDDESIAGPSQPPLASTAPSAVFSQPLDLLPIRDAAPHAIVPSMAAPAEVDESQNQEGVMSRAALDSARSGLMGSGSELSDASIKRIADAVAERTLGQHKRVLSYLNDGHREMLRIIKGDIGKEGKRLQLAFDAQVKCWQIQ